MTNQAGRYQFFYSTNFRARKWWRVLKEEGFDENVPTRDVLGTWNNGNKTEPFLERWVENWCPCRKPQIRVAVKEAANTSSHYLILTTRNPYTGKMCAVGYLCFSKRRHSRLSILPQFDGRAVYPGEPRRSKIVSFHDAYHFSADNFQAIPGGRQGKQIVTPYYLSRILKRLRKGACRRHAFLRNVKICEALLKCHRRGLFDEYRERLNPKNQSGLTCAEGRHKLPR